MITLRHEDGDEETVVEWSLRHYELRHMGYKEVDENEKPKTISELRRKLAIKTAPNHGLLQLYKRNN